MQLLLMIPQLIPPIKTFPSISLQPYCQQWKLLRPGTCTFSCCFRSPGLLNVERQRKQNWLLGDSLLLLGMEGVGGSGGRRKVVRSNSEEEKLVAGLDGGMVGYV